MALSTSKVSLGPVGATAGPPPPLTFLVTVKHAEAQRNLLLNLDFAINELEYGIRTVANAGSYQASSWLTFVRPFDHGATRRETAIPQVQIPIPLRAYPQPSVLTGQSGLASPPGATEFPEARHWDYRYDVRSGRRPRTPTTCRSRSATRRSCSGRPCGPTLYAVAGGVHHCRPRVERRPRPPARTRGRRARPGRRPRGRGTRDLAENVAAGDRRSRALADAAGRGATAAYGYGMTTLDDGTNLESLTLVPELGPTGASAVWPAMYLRRPEGAERRHGAGLRLRPDAGYRRRLPLPATGREGQ